MKKTETEEIFVEGGRESPISEGCQLGCGLLIALACAAFGIKIFYWIMEW